MRKSIAKHHFSQVDNLTASFGVSQVNTHSNSNQDAIHQADKALYQAKNEGRDRVIVFKPDPQFKKTSRPT